MPGLTMGELVGCYAAIEQEAYDEGELEVGDCYRNVIDDLREVLAGEMPERLLKYLGPQEFWVTRDA